MHQRTTPRRHWTVLMAFALFAALFTAIGTSPAGGQAAAPTITDPGPQAHDVGHRACTGLRASSDVDDWEVENGSLLPPGIRLDADVVDPTLGRLGGEPLTTGTYTFRVRAVSDALGAGPWLTIRYQVFTPNRNVPVIKAGRLDQAFTIDCFSQGWLANEFLSDPANFGPSGQVRLPRGLSIHEQTGTDGNVRITAAYLADADILFDGFVGEGSYSAKEIRLIRRWVNNGGVLIAAEDNQLSDRLGEVFGAPTEGFIVPSNDGEFWLHCGDPSDIPNADDVPGQPTCPRFRPARGAADHPIVDGPFGSWSRIDTDGTVGYLEPGFGRTWTRVANHPNGRATIVERKVGNGHVIIVSDEGTFRTNLDGANGTYIGNLFAFALDQVTEVPDVSNDVLTGTVFRRFSANICNNDDTGDGRTRVRITGGSLPPDLQLRGCRITGTPRLGSFGTFGATYTLTDADGDTDTGRIQITINSAFDGSGNDRNPACKGVSATIVGTPGADVIRGTSGPDVIVAGGGKDVIRGLGGNDIICGGKGADTIIGGGGRDTCIGGPGADRLRSCERRN